MIEIKNSPKERTRNQDNKASFIKYNAAITTIVTRTVAKTLKSQVGKVGSSPTMRSRTITRTNNPAGPNVQAPHLAGMNSSTVVSTGSGSGPGVNTLTSNLDAHGVFSIDALNELPTYSDLFKWISDSYSLIKEFNLWSVQNQVAQSCCEATPNRADQALVNAASKNGLSNHNCNDDVGKISGNNAPTWSEDFDIVHGAILSQDCEALHV